MSPDELLALIEGITSTGGVAQTAVQAQQHSAISQIEAARRTAHHQFFDDAFTSLLGDLVGPSDKVAIRRGSEQVAEMAILYADAALKKWDDILRQSLKRAGIIKSKFDLMKDERLRKKKEAH